MKRTQKVIVILMALFMLMPIFSGIIANAATDVTEDFSDPIFRAEVYQVIGKTAPTPILDTDVAGITTLIVGNKGISSLAGIEHFLALERLDCYANQLTELDVSKNTALTRLECWMNHLEALDLSNHTNLIRLECYSNQLTELDVSKNANLSRFDCSGNQLAELDVSKNTILKYLDCSGNQLTELDISKNIELTHLICGNNQLPALDVSKNTRLIYFTCGRNQLTTLNLSKNIELMHFDCRSNQLYDVIGYEDEYYDPYYANNQALTIPVVAIGNGTYISKNTYPLSDGKTISLMSVASYDAVTSKFTVTELGLGVLVGFETRNNQNAYKVIGTITFIEEPDVPSTKPPKITKPPAVPDKSTVNRIFGNDRFQTAIEISKTGWTKADNIMLASGLNFPDALAGGPLATMLDAPILLTKGTTLETIVLNRISELAVKNIYILGGTAVISEDIVSQLKTMGYNVVRLADDDRYGTAVAIAKKMDEIRGSAPEFVFVSDGLNYADALSATPVAGIKGIPILFTPNNKAGFNATSVDYASICGTKTAIILGGTSAVKSDVETKLTDIGFTFDRISGADRYETSAKIYAAYKSLFTGDKALMATGLNFPDALTGGALGGKLKAPLFLVNGTGYTSTSIKSALADLSPNIIYVLGGTSVVTDSVVNNHVG